MFEENMVRAGLLIVEKNLSGPPSFTGTQKKSSTCRKIKAKSDNAKDKLMAKIKKQQARKKNKHVYFILFAFLLKPLVSLELSGFLYFLLESLKTSSTTWMFYVLAELSLFFLRITMVLREVGMYKNNSGMPPPSHTKMHIYMKS